jgi:hypothetical protein
MDGIRIKHNKAINSILVKMKGCFDSIDGIKAEYLVWYEYFPDWSG